MSREQEIEARERAATPGPWEGRKGGASVIVGREGEKFPPHIARVYQDEGGLRTTHYIADFNQGGIDPRGEADAEFAAHAREDIPYLLAELKEAREKLEAVKDVTNDLDDLAQGFKDEGGPKLEVAEAVWAWVTRYNRILEGGD